jgi:hypothetical protein
LVLLVWVVVFFWLLAFGFGLWVFGGVDFLSLIDEAPFQVLVINL